MALSSGICACVASAGSIIKFSLFDPFALVDKVIAQMPIAIAALTHATVFGAVSKASSSVHG
jgi:hypothetical protein